MNEENNELLSLYNLAETLAECTIPPCETCLDVAEPNENASNRCDEHHDRKLLVLKLKLNIIALIDKAENVGYNNCARDVVHKVFETHGHSAEYDQIREVIEQLFEGEDE